MTRLFTEITRLALRFRWLTIGLTLAVLLVGGFSLIQLNQELVPNIEFPVNVVIVRWPADSAEDMVQQITIPMEVALRDVPNVLDLTGESGDSFAFVQIRSEFGTDKDKLRSQVVERLARVDWPEGVIRGVNVFAPDLLDDLTPDMLVRLAPDAIRALPASFVDDLDSDLQARLDAILAEAEPLPLPQSWVETALALGVGIQSTADLNPDLVALLYEANPEIFSNLNDELILAFSPPVQLALPGEALPEGMEARLDHPQLPASWQSYGQELGVPLRTTADVSAEVLEGSIMTLDFGMGDLPVINVSASSNSLNIMELKGVVADRVVPELEAIEGVGAVEVSGGEELDQEKALAMRQTLRRRIEYQGQGPRLPLAWVAMASQQGMEVQTVGDLTPEFMQMASGLGRGALAELTPDMLRNMLPETLAALPGYYVAELDPDLRAELETLAAPAGGLAEPEPLPPGMPLPDSWTQAAADSFRGMITVETTSDLGPLLVSFLLNPGDGDNPNSESLLNELTPDMLNALPENVLTGLPGEYYLGLDDDFKSRLNEPVLALIDLAERRETLKEEAPILPNSWIDTLAQNGYIVQTAADLDVSAVNQVAQHFPDLIPALRPDIIEWMTQVDPTFLPSLDPSALQLMSPETLTAAREAQPEFWASLDDDLQALLDGIADGVIVAETYQDTVNRTNSGVSLRLSANKESDANTVVVTHALLDRLDELEQELGNVQFDIVFEQASFIEESISGVAREGGLGAIFAVIIIMLFLSGRIAGRWRPAWRSTLVTAVSIPTSVLAGFALLWAYGYTLNIMTLSGMTVAVGRVVDDSIVVLENIYRHIQKGAMRRRAVIDGTKEVAVAIFASTATTVAVFLPIGFVGGMISEFFLPFAWVVTFALASSFVVAITIVPLLAYLFIRKEHLPEESEGWMQRGYGRILGWVLNPNPWVNVPVLRWFANSRFITMLVAMAIFVGSLFLMAQLPQTFIPSLGEPTVNVSLDLPQNDMVVTDATVRLVEEKLEEMRQAGRIETYQTVVGMTGGFGSMFDSGISQDQAGLEAIPANGEDADALAAELRAFVEGLVGEEHASVSAGDITSGFGSFELVVTAEDMDSLTEINDAVLETLESVDGLVNVTSRLSLDREGQPTTIGRSNGQLAVTFEGEVIAEDTLGVLAQAKERVLELDLPADTQVSEGFAAEQQTQGFADMGRSIGFSIIIVYVIMVSTFAAGLPPFDILFSLPFAVVGAAVALTVTDRVLGISSMVGLMMLVGIVVTNAIVLLDLVQQLRRRGYNTYDALIEGGKTRLRPIWMTALAAILALVPQALEVFASGVIIGADLAIVVIGGLLFSTIISLMIVPIAYSLTDSAVRLVVRHLPQPIARQAARVLMGEGAANTLAAGDPPTRE